MKFFNSETLLCALFFRSTAIIFFSNNDTISFSSVGVCCLLRIRFDVVLRYRLQSCQIKSTEQNYSTK